MQRDEDAWELGLADIRVNPDTECILQSDISDLRLDKEFCDVVATFINQPDLTNIFNHYQSKFQEVETHWDGWFADTKEEWADLKSLYIGWFSQIKAELFAQTNTDFEDRTTKAGYRLKTKFMDDSNVAEAWINSNNGSILAARVTESLDDDNIKVTIKYNEPELSITSEIVFSKEDGVAEVNEEVY